MKLNNKTILVTGGTGSFGQKFVQTVLKYHSPKKIIVFSRDELKQYEMQRRFIKYGKLLRFFIGDIRDLTRVKTALNSHVDIVIHTAALKQVPTAEYNPFETIKTNVLGTQNIVEACLASDVTKMIALSTDKACAPTNLYGSSKLAADKLVISANNIKGAKDIKFSIVRYGNVIGSRGSVLPLFQEYKNKGYFPITDTRMTRFNMTLEYGVKFVINCMDKMMGGEIFVPKLRAYKITDLARAINPKNKHKIVGIRPGEKIHEELITARESGDTMDLKGEYIILPNFTHLDWNLSDFLKIYKKYKPKKCVDGFSYTSDNKELLKIKDLTKLIKEYNTKNPH